MAAHANSTPSLEWANELVKSSAKRAAHLERRTVGLAECIRECMEERHGRNFQVNVDNDAKFVLVCLAAKG